MASAGRPSQGAPVTITEVVGRNVRLVREQRGWDLARLVDEAAYVDLPWDPAAIIAVALHASAAEDDTAGLEDVVLYAETHMPAGEFANWIWDPDSHAATHVELAESELWSRSTTMP